MRPIRQSQIELKQINWSNSQSQLRQILFTKYDELTKVKKIAIKTRLYVIQDGLCALCDERLEFSKSVLDHNHVTGYIRGLLCSSCNTGLGMFKDNKNIIIKALKYITSVYSDAL